VDTGDGIVANFSVYAIAGADIAIRSGAVSVNLEVQSCGFMEPLINSVF